MKNFRDLFFWRRPAVTDIAALAQFIDEQSAFLAQKGIYEYSRARAGHYAKVMFSEPAFIEAVDAARWRAFPLSLSMVAEVIEGVLCRHAAVNHSGVLEQIGAVVLAVFDRYPVPATIGEADWRNARTDLARRLEHIGLHPPKRAIAIADPYARAYFNLMPIHKSLRGSDFPTLHSYLKLTLCNVHDELTKRMDGDALIASLRQAGAAASGKT